jgi:hypothetical protein
MMTKKKRKPDGREIQFNVRIKQSTMQRVERLKLALEAAYRIPVSLSDIVELALEHFEETKYPPKQEEQN